MLPIPNPRPRTSWSTSWQRRSGGACRGRSRRNTRVLEGNGRTREALALSKIYEELRLRNYFSDRIKEILRTPKQDFKLVEKGAGDWQMHPINYGPAQLLACKGRASEPIHVRQPLSRNSR